MLLPKDEARLLRRNLQCSPASCSQAPTNPQAHGTEVQQSPSRMQAPLQATADRSSAAISGKPVGDQWATSREPIGKQLGNSGASLVNPVAGKSSSLWHRAKAAMAQQSAGLSNQHGSVLPKSDPVPAIHVDHTNQAAADGTQACAECPQNTGLESQHGAEHSRSEPAMTQERPKMHAATNASKQGVVEKSLGAASSFSRVHCDSLRCLQRRIAADGTQDCAVCPQNTGLESQHGAGNSRDEPDTMQDCLKVHAAANPSQAKQGVVEKSMGAAASFSSFHCDSLKCLRRRIVAKKRKRRNVIPDVTEGDDSAASSCEIATMTFIEPDSRQAVSSVEDHHQAKRQCRGTSSHLANPSQQ